MAKLSVIVPVYRIEKYIERCARSLFEQTMKDIEIIFIDDCTPDGSIEVLRSIIQEYEHCLAEEQKSVFIRRMPVNSGVAAVRNYGIQLASGDFIIHCDGDDWVDKDLYNQMYHEAIRSGAEVVLCPVVEEWADKSTLKPWNYYGDNCQKIVEEWYHKSLYMFTVNKLVSKSVYINNNIFSFEGINMWEDNGLMLRVFYYAKGLSQINMNGSYYHYNRKNENALTNKYGRESVNQMILCARKLSDFFDGQPDSEKYRKTVNTLKFFAKLNLIDRRYDWLREFRQLFPECNEAPNWINIDSFSRKGKIRFLFVKYHMAWLFVTINKLLNTFTIA